MHDALRTAIKMIAMLRKVEKPSLEDVAQGQSSGSDVERAQYRIVANWAMTGMNVFNLSDSLAHALILTDLPTTEESHRIKLPYKAFFLSIPEGIIPYSQEGDEISWVTLIGIGPVPKDPHTLDKFPHPLAELDRDLPQNRLLDVSIHDKEYYISMIADTLINPKTANALSSEHMGVLEGEEWRVNSGRMIPKLLANFCLWLDASGSTDTQKKKLNVLDKKRKRKNGAWPEIWVVGKKVKVSPELKDIAKGLALTESGSKAASGWKLRMQHAVRGHWKMQAHGPKRSLRKRVWVEPYIRGPEGKVAWAHVYEA